MRAKVHGHFHEILGGRRPKRGEPPLACFAHFGLASEVVEFQEQSGLFDRRLFCHLFLRIFGEDILPLAGGFCCGPTRGRCSAVRGARAQLEALDFARDRLGKLAAETDFAGNLV